MEALKDRLIIALDVARASDAQKIVSEIGESASTYKVGKQLFTAEGPQVVRDLVASGRKVFLDLKFHDIPNTVAGAVASAAALNASMLTVHASGGSKMLRAAAESAASSSSKPIVLAVTVLTSLNDEDLQELGLPVGVADQVLRLAGIARNAGCHGLVASAHEATSIRRSLGEGFPIVTPGVRFAGGDVGDQARVVTPAEAIRAGATHVVMGRPITSEKNPKAAAQRALEELKSVAAKV
jgi:orotidine-5'-phosphate decarboxylase